MDTGEIDGAVLENIGLSGGVPYINTHSFRIIS